MTSFKIDFDKEQNTLFETDNEEFNKDIKNIKKFIKNSNDRYENMKLLLYPNFKKIKNFEDIYNVNNLHIFFVFQSRSQPEKYYFRMLSANRKKINKVKIVNYFSDVYYRVYVNIRLHQLIALNYCDTKQCKEYIKAKLNKKTRLTNIDIDHIDGDSSNDDPSNLQIITHKENTNKRRERNQETNIVEIPDKEELKPITKINDDELKYTYYLYNDKIYRELKGKKRNNEYKEIIGKEGNDGKIYYKFQKENKKSQAIKTLEEIKKIIDKGENNEEEEKEAPKGCLNEVKE